MLSAALLLFAAFPPDPAKPAPITRDTVSSKEIVSDDVDALDDLGSIRAKDVRIVLDAIQECQAINAKKAPLKDGWKGRSESDRHDYQMICIAYGLGKSHGKQ